jgi:transposase-like protein
MPPVDRNNPIRAESSQSKYSLMEFMREFPDDDACLQWLWRTRVSEDGKTAECPKCERPRPFHKVKDRPAWDCDYCGYHLHPTAGTIFHKSSTSLHLWFYAMYLMTSTRCGISAKQLERELGVTYKTAHRMMKRIRTHLMNDDGDGPLWGDVEVDETSVRGKWRGPKRPHSEAAKWRERQPSVIGMVERGGRVRLRVIPSRRGPALSRAVRANVNPYSLLITDDWQAYKQLGREFIGHKVINHSAGQYVDGFTHTNTIEGFFGNLKTGMRGAYKHVSAKYLQSYLDEYAWRYNHRHDGGMFDALLARAVRS